MPDKAFKKIQVVGCSMSGLEKAVEMAVAKTGESVHGLSWFEVKEIRGAVLKDGKIEWQATVELGFKVD
jgi:hypothetical protein